MGKQINTTKDDHKGLKYIQHATAKYLPTAFPCYPSEPLNHHLKNLEATVDSPQP